jgi:c-di-GMP-binding flagellar brake protein YcgR
MKTVQVDSTVPIQDADPFLNCSDAEQDVDAFLDRRAAERAPVDCPISFISEERYDSGSKVTGTLCDLSKTGCKIFSLRPPPQGTQITLILHLPDGRPPMYLIGTIVRHVHGHVFGAEFLPLVPEERRRIQAIIFKNLTWSVYSLRRPAFRIA